MAAAAAVVVAAVAAAAAVVVAAVAAATEAAATASMAAKMEEVVLVMTTLRKLENQAHVVSKCRAEVRGRAFESLMAHQVDIEEEVGGRKQPPAELPESVSSAGGCEGDAPSGDAPETRTRRRASQSPPSFASWTMDFCDPSSAAAAAVDMA